MSTAPRQQPALSSESRRTWPPRFLRSAPRRRVPPVASAHVDGFTRPVAGIGTAARHRSVGTRAPALLFTALVMALCTGCGSPAPFTQEKTMDAQAELA